MNKATLDRMLAYFLPDEDMTNLDALTPVLYLDPTKTYVKFSAFIADTDEAKELADLLDCGRFCFDSKERAYIMAPKFLPSAILMATINHVFIDY